MVGHSHAAPADVPELADRPYALGRVLHIAGQEKLSENEWASLPSPDGTLSALYSSSGSFVGVWRTTDQSFVLRPGSVPDPGHVMNGYWTDDHTVRFIVGVGGENNHRLATLDLTTRRLTRSATMHGDLRIAADPQGRS